MELKDGKILVSSSDHEYYVADVVKVKAVYNTVYSSYSEYVGDEYLEDGDIVIDALVAR